MGGTAIVADASLPCDSLPSRLVSRFGAVQALGSIGPIYKSAGFPNYRATLRSHYGGLTYSRFTVPVPAEAITPNIAFMRNSSTSATRTHGPA